ncbi:MAG TPA: glycosyltransferase family 39 protein [bacterium]|nr:glycosyltransferase family 39 protein [bacterium]
MSPSSNAVFRNKAVWGLLLAWVGLVFAHYFSLKSAFDFSFLSTVVSVLPQADLGKLADNWLAFLLHLLCAIAVAFVLWRLGRGFLRWVGLNETPLALRFCLEMGLGIVLANTLWLGLGLNLLWFEPLEWLLGLALLGWALWDFSRGLLKFQKFPRLPLPGRFFLLVGLLGVVSLALDLLQGIAPDVYYDALVYHLSTLQFWKFHHGIANFYTNLYSYFPFGAELYFGNGFFFGGSETAKLLNAFSAGLCGLAAAAWVGEETGWDKGLLVWAMVLTLPLVSATVWTTQNDVFLAFFLVLFLYALVRWVQDSSNRSWALAAGLLGGAALAIKYTAVVAVVLGLVATLAIYRKDALRQEKGRGWALIFFLVVFSIAPWLLKNWAFTGNGFYPYLPSLFGGRTLPAENLKALMADHQAVFNGAFSPRAWVVRVLGVDLDKTIAPLLFGFIPFLFLGKAQRSLTRFLLFLSLLLLLSGFLISHQPRLMIPAFVVCLMDIGLVLGDVERKGAAFAWGAVVVAFGILSLLSLGRLSVDYYKTQNMACGVENRGEYLADNRQTNSFYDLTMAVSLLSPGSQLLIEGDARGLYYPRPFYTNSYFDPRVLAQMSRSEKDGDGIRKRLREMGIDAIVFSGKENQRLVMRYPSYFQPAAGRLQDFVQRWTDLIYLNGLNAIYRLRTTPAGPRPPVPDLFKLFGW